MRRIDKVSKFVDDIGWMFDINNYNRIIILKKRDRDNEDVLAYIQLEEEYQRVTLNIYPKFFTDETEKEQRKDLLHELCHCITLPSKLIALDLLAGNLVTPETIKRENERLTSRIENIIHSLMIGDLRYATKAYNGYIKTKKKEKK